MHVDLEALCGRSTLGLNESQSLVDLQLEILREAIVGYTNECAANLDDLTLTERGCKVKDVLEAVSSVSSHLDVTMHDCGLGNLDQALYTIRVSEKLQVLGFLLVTMLERVFEQGRSFANKLHANSLN